MTQELPQGFRWLNLQPGISKASQQIVCSENFLNLVRVLDSSSDPNLCKVKLDVFY